MLKVWKDGLPWMCYFQSRCGQAMSDVCWEEDMGGGHWMDGSRLREHIECNAGVWSLAGFLEARNDLL